MHAVGSAWIYDALCRRPVWQFDNPDQFIYYGLEQVVPTVASAINYPRIKVTGPAINKVVIFGHSGGGSLQPFYQNIAENGPRVCQGSEQIIPCIDNDLHNLPKADGVIIFDAHPGLGFVRVTYCGPSPYIVNAEPPGNVSENRDPTLDMFSAREWLRRFHNQWRIPQEFVKRFLEAQEVRNQELLNPALNLLHQEALLPETPTRWETISRSLLLAEMRRASGRRIWRRQSEHIRFAQLYAEPAHAFIA